MKVHSTEKKKRNEKDLKSADLNNIVKEKELNELSPEEIDNLTADDLEYLRQKYQVKHPKPTIIGKEPYEPFLAGITDNTWMSVGDKIKED